MLLAYEPSESCLLTSDTQCEHTGEKKADVTYGIPFPVPLNVAGDALSPRLRAAASHAHCAVALAELCGFFLPLLLLPLYERNGSLVQQAAMLRGGEMASRHDPIGGLSSRCTAPRGIPLLDKPRAGSQGEPSERHRRVKHTQLGRATRLSLPFPFPLLFFFFLFFIHALVRD